MLGKRTQIIAWFRRNNLSISAAGAAVVLISFFTAALIDLAGIVKHKDQQIQEAALHAQLVEFLLMTTREPDGSSLLDNPLELARAKRPLQIITVQRPFFSYFLTKSNQRSFRVDSARLDFPRSCVLEFPMSPSLDAATPTRTLQVCFAALPADPAGRYVYFVLRYPTGAIRTHIRGQSLAEADLITLRFRGVKTSSIQLAFESPPLKDPRRTAAPGRFDGLYEIAAFLPDDGGRPTQAVNAQALARIAPGDLEPYVTILGRIDSAAFGGASEPSAWPSPVVKGMRIGVSVRQSDGGTISVGEGMQGSAVISLEQAYLSAVTSRARLAVYAGNKAEGRPLWQSDDLDSGRITTGPDWFERLGARIAQAIAAGIPPIHTTQRHASPRVGNITAIMTTDGVAVPNIAARALAWLVAAIVGIVMICLVMWRLFVRLGALSRTAYAVARAHRGKGFEQYAKQDDQIGTLGRVLHLLYKRHRDRMARHRRRAEIEMAAARRRHDNLRAIGHEIKSPLANLLTRAKKDGPDFRDLSRIHRSVEAFYEASRIEDGVKNGVIVIEKQDLAAFLYEYADGATSPEMAISYSGPASDVLAAYDDLSLNQVVDNLVDNAMRHRIAGTTVEFHLTHCDREWVTFEVVNQGAGAKDEVAIFQLGVSDAVSETHLGLGLYIARFAIEAMGGTIRAENRPGAFAIIIQLRTSSR